MQKKLLTIAVAGALAAPALALAQSSVQVYGRAYLSLNRTSFSADTAGTLGADTKYGVSIRASYWGLRSTESLGGGMTAWFQAEFLLWMAPVNGVNDGDPAARNSGLGLRGNFGNIYLGTWETPWMQTFRMWNVGTVGAWGPVFSIIGRREVTGTAPSRNCANVQSALGSGAAGGGTPNAPVAAGAASGVGAGSATPNNICGNGADTPNYAAPLGYPLFRRFSYALFYETPVWNGLRGKLAVQPNERKANYVTEAAATATAAATVNENPSAWSGSITWTGMGGRARAFIANMRAKDWTAVGNTDSGYTAGGGYNFGPVDVGFVMERYSYQLATGESRAKEWALGLAVPLGPGKIGASYANASDLSGSGSPGTNTGAKMWNIGYEWTLSKRTALGFGITKIDNGTAGAFTWAATIPNQNGFSSSLVSPGQDQINIFISMSHSF